MKISGNQRILAGFACSYLILLIIPVFMGISTYSSTVQLSQSNVIASTETLLDQFGRSIDNSIDTARQFAFSFRSIPNSLLAFSSEENRSSKQVYAVRTAIDNLQNHMDSNGFANEYFIIAYDTDIIVTPHAGYLDSQSYFSSHISSQVADYTLWYDAIRNVSTPRVQMIHTVSDDPLLIYGMPFSLIGGANPNYSFIFNLDTQALRNLMEPLLQSGVAQMYIFNDLGELLLSDGAQTSAVTNDFFETMNLTASGNYERTIDGQRMLISFWKGHNVSVVTAIPHAAISQRASGVLHTVLLYLILFILAELLLCIWIVRHNQQPVSRMLNHLDNIDNGRRFTIGLSEIENAVVNLSANARSLENSLQEQKLLLRTAYVNRLIHGDIIDESEAEHLFNQVDFPIEGHAMRGIYMYWKTHVPSEQMLNYLRAQVIELLDQFAPELQFISLSSSHCFALLYIAAEPEADRHAEVLRALYSCLKLERGVDVSFFVGHRCTHLMHVHESYSAAAVLMHNISDEDERFLFEAEDSIVESESNLNLMREEQKLSNLLAVGNISAIGELLETMDQEYFRARPVDNFTQKLFYYRIIDALVRANQELPLPPELRYSLSSLSPEQFFAFTKAHCERLCAMQQEKKQQRTTELISKIAEYIDQNFSNPDISLCTVAVEFGLTESYLSSFIKEKLGETFSARVERLRIEKANQLLCGTDLRIDIVAEQVGYATANSFRRAYRRVQGFSPSDYRTEKRS